MFKYSQFFVFVLGLVALPGFAEDDVSNWFEFKPPTQFSNSAISMSDWLEAPAGEHGFVQIERDKLVFEDGTPVVFWGTNINNARVAPEPRKSEKWAEFLAAFGINGVRFHKFTWHGKWQGIGGETVSTELDPEGFDRFDYFNHQLKKRGIYTGWSHIFGHRVRPGDSTRVLAWQEIMDLEKPGYLDNSTYGLVMISEDLQDLNIELTVNMLNHVNPYTGLRYADDPALAFIEFQNEDNVWWPSTHNAVMGCPTYKKILCEKFSDWLFGKYGSQDNLIEAWGEEGLNAFPDFQKGESLEERNIFAVAHCFYYTPESLSSQTPGVKRRLLDSAEFLHELQRTFYKRFKDAIRYTGYKGALVASCWQAGSGVPHYYNIYSDSEIGIIDRHNYFGGGTGHSMKPGKVRNVPMVAEPGSGLLSNGMQQVGNRPFSLSEWMSLIPNEWTAEASPIIAAYGMGLQGWDASFSFAVDRQDYSETIHTPGVYNVTTPTQLGLYPALGRMVYRGDVKEGDVIATRYVHIPSLSEGRIGFQEVVTQDHDVKSITGDIPSEFLAAGRVVLDFPDEWTKTPLPDIRNLWDFENRQIKSNTGQLMWDFSDKGYFIINTPGTQGAVGFFADKEIKLDDVIIKSANEFAVILISSLDKLPVTESKKVLITTIARARNTGMKYNADKTELLEPGEAPILLEPVEANIRFLKAPNVKVTVLDHGGFKTKQKLKMKDGIVVVDGKQDKAVYYLLER